VYVQSDSLLLPILGVDHRCHHHLPVTTVSSEVFTGFDERYLPLPR
jgi:hypothetical protein